jgi:hypothetical protein
MFKIDTVWVIGQRDLFEHDALDHIAYCTVPHRRFDGDHELLPLSRPSRFPAGAARFPLGFRPPWGHYGHTGSEA